MLKEPREKFEALQPLVQRMNEKQASEFSELMADCRAAAEQANKLEEHIRDCKIKKDELLSGFEQHDSDRLETFLAELEEILNKINYPLYSLGRYDDMFANLETEALITEEKWQAAEKETAQ
jgi:flagellar biosynthesis chaperone FliJ